MEIKNSDFISSLALGVIYYWIAVCGTLVFHIIVIHRKIFIISLHISSLKLLLPHLIPFYDNLRNIFKKSHEVAMRFLPREAYFYNYYIVNVGNFFSTQQVQWYIFLSYSKKQLKHKFESNSMDIFTYKIIKKTATFYVPSIIIIRNSSLQSTEEPSVSSLVYLTICYLGAVVVSVS